MSTPQTLEDTLDYVPVEDNSENADAVRKEMEKKTAPSFISRGAQQARENARSALGVFSRKVPLRQVEKKQVVKKDDGNAEIRNKFEWPKYSLDRMMQKDGNFEWIRARNSVDDGYYKSLYPNINYYLKQGLLGPNMYDKYNKFFESIIGGKKLISSIRNNLYDPLCNGNVGEYWDNSRLVDVEGDLKSDPLNSSELPTRNKDIYVFWIIDNPRNLHIVNTNPSNEEGYPIMTLSYVNAWEKKRDDNKIICVRISSELPALILPNYYETTPYDTDSISRNDKSRDSRVIVPPGILTLTDEVIPLSLMTVGSKVKWTNRLLPGESVVGDDLTINADGPGYEVRGDIVGTVMSKKNIPEGELAERVTNGWEDEFGESLYVQFESTRHGSNPYTLAINDLELVDPKNSSLSKFSIPIYDYGILDSWIYTRGRTWSQYMRPKKGGRKLKRTRNKRRQSRKGKKRRRRQSRKGRNRRRRQSRRR